MKGDPNAEELDRTVCPICKGKGHAFYDKKVKCNVCEGYGIPVWHEAFRKLVDEGKISSPKKHKKKYTRFIELALKSKDYNEFQKRYRSVGLREITLPELKQHVQTWNKKHLGNLDIPWMRSMVNNLWHEEEKRIVLMARGYCHYEVLIDEYNKSNNMALPIRSRQAVAGWRHSHEAEFSWHKGESFLLEKLNANGIRTGEFLLFNGFGGFHCEIKKVNSPLRSGVWLITDIEIDGRMGTTEDFLLYVKNHSIKVGKKVYRAWLIDQGKI